jgi:hypothetical protein
MLNKLRFHVESVKREAYSKMTVNAGHVRREYRATLEEAKMMMYRRVQHPVPMGDGEP